MSAFSYFAGGPAKLPDEVIRKVSADVVSYGNTGIGVLEISHRSPAYLDILNRAINSLKELFDVPSNYKILLLPGGATGQFGAVPMNLMQKTGKADYFVTGTWSERAAKEAEKYGSVQLVLPPQTSYEGVPDPSTWQYDPDASYVFYCDNESVQGVEFQSIPEPPPGVPLVCDMTSNLGSVNLDISKFGIIFASAQKNMGCAGVTMVIIREDLLDWPRLPECPIIMNYANVAKQNSNYNTPPVYAVHVLGEVAAWVNRKGGLKAMDQLSTDKSMILYDAIDNSDGFYCNPIKEDCKSRVNVVFTIGIGDTRNRELETKFIAEAAQNNVKAIDGHWIVGGMRASIFNSVYLEDVQRLIDFMEVFRKQNYTALLRTNQEG